jgi:hypothetical protein
MPLRRSRIAALLAVLAIALQVFWPLLAQARPRVAGVLVPVCTLDGTTHYLELPPGKSPLDERSASHGEHCKLCVFGDAKSVAVPASDRSAFLLLDDTGQGTTTIAIPFREPPHRLPAQPRAPPAIS